MIYLYIVYEYIYIYIAASPLPCPPPPAICDQARRPAQSLTVRAAPAYPVPNGVSAGISHAPAPDDAGGARMPRSTRTPCPKVDSRKMGNEWLHGGLSN